MPRVIALVSGFGWHVSDLSRAACELKIDFLPIDFRHLSTRSGGTGPQVSGAGVDLTQADGILVRMMPPGSLEQVVFRMDALHQLESLGVRLMNPPRAIETAVDKYLTLARLERNGLPVPETWVGESAEEALAVFEAMDRDVVVKPLFGSEGRGLIRVSDRELAWRAFRSLERVGSVLYVQRFIPHPGYDYRVFVLGERVLGAIRRRSTQADWRTNVAQGARAEAHQIDAEMERLSRMAADSVGSVMAGIDLLPDPIRGGMKILEVNAVPGWRALAAATGVDVARALLSELLDDAR